MNLTTSFSNSDDRISSRCMAALLLTLVCLLCSGQAWAAGGITMNGYQPHFATQENKRDFVDMRVKVLGGDIAITRRWVGDRWEWNSPWNDIEVNYPKPWLEEGGVGEVSTGTSSSSAVGVSIDNPYFGYYAIRNGQAYILPPFQNISTLLLANDGKLVYENGIKLTLTQDPSNHHWLWQDRRGNQIKYNEYGQMDYYQDRNSVRVSVTRNTAGNITEVRDHFGTTVMTKTWEDIPGAELIQNKRGDDVYPQRPTQLQDHTGRTVVYNWNAANQLEAVVDVRGEAWTTNTVATS
jgi:hypothetical protein